MSFEVYQEWNSSFPRITKPEVIGYFSLNGKREFLDDLSQLKYYYHERNHSSLADNSRVQLNLNYGVEDVIRKHKSNEKLTHLLRWILLNYSRITAPLEAEQWLKPDFICYRGLLSLLWRTPYEEEEDWMICAAKFKGTIYLLSVETEQAERKKRHLTPRNLKMMSWGFKFEQYMLSDAPREIPKTSEPVNELEEFSCIFTTQFGKNSLLYGAEMDGIESDEKITEFVQLQHVKFIELKTNRIIETSRQNMYFKKKILKWWCQSFLVGIEDIICGFRTNDGTVIELKRFKVRDLIKMSKDYWVPAPCMNFCDTFLNHIKETVTEDHNKCIYRFYFKPRSKIEMSVLKTEFLSECEKENYVVLPEWFTEKIVELRQKKFSI